MPDVSKLAIKMSLRLMIGRMIELGADPNNVIEALCCVLDEGIVLLRKREEELSQIVVTPQVNSMEE